MMEEQRLVIARASAEAAQRIGAARPAHLALIRPMAERGVLLLGVPLMDGEGAYRGSAMLLRPDAVEEYLEAEPFRRDGVWGGHEVLPFRIASLPYRPFPTQPTPAHPTHTLVIARDGTDDAALDRRLAVRDRHFARVRQAASDGVLVLGGAILDAPGGRMVGSVAVTAHAGIGAAEAFWAEDPYVTGDVWRAVEWHATRLAPLPYRPLPGAEG